MFTNFTMHLIRLFMANFRWLQWKNGDGRPAGWSGVGSGGCSLGAVETLPDGRNAGGRARSDAALVELPARGGFEGRAATGARRGGQNCGYRATASALQVAADGAGRCRQCRLGPPAGQPPDDGPQGWGCPSSAPSQSRPSTWPTAPTTLFSRLFSLFLSS